MLARGLRVGYVKFWSYHVKPPKGVMVKCEPSGSAVATWAASSVTASSALLRRACMVTSWFAVLALWPAACGEPVWSVTPRNGGRPIRNEHYGDAGQAVGLPPLCPRERPDLSLNRQVWAGALGGFRSGAGGAPSRQKDQSPRQTGQGAPGCPP